MVMEGERLDCTIFRHQGKGVYLRNELDLANVPPCACLVHRRYPSTQLSRPKIMTGPVTEKRKRFLLIF